MKSLFKASFVATTTTPCLAVAAVLCIVTDIDVLSVTERATTEEGREMLAEGKGRRGEKIMGKNTNCVQ